VADGDALTDRRATVVGAAADAVTDRQGRTAAGRTEPVSSLTPDRPSLVGVGAVVVLVGLSVVGWTAGLTKVLTISWVAFLAMALAAVVGARSVNAAPTRLVWGYGLAAGAMVTSAAVFLVPQAIGYDPKVGGFGIAGGLLAGYAAHTVGHRLSHLETPFDTTAAQITAHALSAGVIIGLTYAVMPELSLVLGLAIVSHKGPAGYAAAGRLVRAGKPPSVLLLPAAGVGLTALPAALVDFPSVATLEAAVFGFAAGVFLHVAMDFLPECEAGSEVATALGRTEGDDVHAALDRLRLHAVGSTALGALAVLAAWLALIA
jgi:ZIP family zinc transporter